jgi:nitrite reductase/ring-hydroxylating ferredoxin subunit
MWEALVSEFLKVAETQDILAGQGKKVHVGGKHIALFTIDGNYYAIDDTCTHKGGPLSEGNISGSTVTCPWHGATFDVKTGEVLKAPAAVGVSSYKVRVIGNDIEIEI